MTQEAKLNVRVNGEYKNLDLKTKYERNGKMLKLGPDKKPIVKLAGIPDGEYIIVEKVMAEGKEIVGIYGTSYTCKVKYGDDEASFFLSDKEHPVYAGLGGEGDKVKITLKVEEFTNPMNGMTGTAQRLYFEKVE